MGEAFIELVVQDDGKGITTDALRSRKSLGLLGIRERAQRLGGSVTRDFWCRPRRAWRGRAVGDAQGHPGGAARARRGGAAVIKVLVADDHAVVRHRASGRSSPRSRTSWSAATPRRPRRYGTWCAGSAGTASSSTSTCTAATAWSYLAELRRDNREVRVLVLTGLPGGPVRRARHPRRGGEGFLTKESAPDKLIEAVRKIAGGGHGTSARSLAETLASLVADETSGPPHQRLSDREFEVFKKLLLGPYGPRKWPKSWALSVKTVSTHRTRILKKMQMSTNAELTHYAVKNELIS